MKIASIGAGSRLKSKETPSWSGSKVSKNQLSSDRAFCSKY
jgi:hypothetical protein